MVDRNNGINFIKFIAMSMVLFIHCRFPGNFGIFVTAFCSIAVPLFFMISGYFLVNCSTEKLYHRFFKMLMLSIYSNLFYLAWDIWYEYMCGRSIIVFLKHSFDLKKILVFIITNESPLRGHLWFIGAVAYCYAAIIIYLRLKKQDSIESTVRELVLGIILLTINIIVSKMLIYTGNGDKILIFCRNWLLDGMPFILIGAYCKDNLRFIEKMNFLAKFVLVFLLLIINALEIAYSSKGDVIFLTTVFLCVVIFKSFSTAKFNNKILCYLGKISDKYGLFFYVLQIAIIKSLDLLPFILNIKKDDLIIWIWPFLCWIIICFIAATVYEIIERLKYTFLNIHIKRTR